ncbi:hypothetical protein [Streptomyces sp. H27-C3]|uniref:hypothetical protein n=1 Tax=Streptomyces sp. H27-C3 TaxID=3046305 RepID=UPI0024BA658D|nr:hypothetical protein [Streptomyces sp. H27-C3]MDJ0460807.1 hypothetical protein [Streptomyces sp. H27-C3]
MTATAKSKTDEAASPTDELAPVDVVAADEAAAEEAEEVAKAERAAEKDGSAVTVEDAEDDDIADDDEEVAPRVSSGVAAGAAAVVSAALGLSALTGTWTSRLAAERETLMGQLTTTQTSSPADQIAAVYGNAWHTTALVNGGFALLALVVGIVVLIRPAFGTPGISKQAGWIRSVAWAGVAIGVVGIILSLGMYFDLFASMPTPPPAAPGAGAGAGAGS